MHPLFENEYANMLTVGINGFALEPFEYSDFQKCCAGIRRIATSWALCPRTPDSLFTATQKIILMLQMLSNAGYTFQELLGLVDRVTSFNEVQVITRELDKHYLWRFM